MPRSAIPTRERIVSAATKLFYGEGIRRVSVDAVAAKAGVTKRTLYYHFKSKDELVAAYLAARDHFAISPVRRGIPNGRAAVSSAPQPSSPTRRGIRR
jgi:AcrR family transcriptional regulator